MKKLIKHIVMVSISLTMALSMSSLAFAEIGAGNTDGWYKDPGAYDILDTDSDGTPDIIRFRDGYEVPYSEHATYYFDRETNTTTSSSANTDTLDIIAGVAKKYPGELQLAREYKEKNEPLEQEYDTIKENIQQNMLTDVLTSYERVEDRVAYIYSDASFNKIGFKIDNNATPLSIASDISKEEFDSHYHEYLWAKYSYESYLEWIPALKGERPVNESDYETIKRDFNYTTVEKIIRDPNDTHFCDTSLTALGKTIRILYINCEWYEMNFADGKFVSMTKGYPDEATQMIIAIGKSNTFNTLGALFDYLPEDAQQKILAAGLTVNR